MSRPAASGRLPEEVDLEAVRAGEVRIGDVSIHPDTLHEQARIAHEHGNPQLAANFHRAAELVSVPDDQILAVYEALRPSRSSFEELEAIAADLEARAAPLNAALVREAALAYRRRGLLRR